MWLKVNKNVDLALFCFCNLREGKNIRYQISLIASFAVGTFNVFCVNFRHRRLCHSTNHSWNCARLSWRLFAHEYRSLMPICESSSRLIWNSSRVFPEFLLFLRPKSENQRLLWANNFITNPVIYRRFAAYGALHLFSARRERVKSCASFSHHQNDNKD